MARDLLYKPPVPLASPDDAEDGKPAPGKRPATRSPATTAVPTAPARAPSRPNAAAGAPAAAEPPTATPPAFAAAYFNRDVVATGLPNPRTQAQQALRGGEGATDLKRVVLPAGAVAAPVPEILGHAGAQMGIGTGGVPPLGELIARLHHNAQQQQMTHADFAALLAELEAMTAARIAAVQRMMRLSADRLARAVSLRHAAQVRGEGMEKSVDIAAEGSALAEAVADDADGMHRRMAKALGIKVQP